jgi:hypothetical protein
MNQEQPQWHSGSLIHDKNERYALQEDGTPEAIVYTFTTADPIQIWLGGRWIEGRIEYAGQKYGYYFLSKEGGFAGLMYGMRARIARENQPH